MKEKLVWLLAIFLLGDSALRAVRTNLTLGNAMMYGITVAVWGYALFQRRVDAFCAAGAGRVLKYVFFAGCGAYLLFALGLFAASFAHPATGNEKAVVVLGAGLRGEQVSGLLARRLDAALAYYRQNPDVLLVVSGGQGPDEAIPEAEAMARYLQAHGVPGENILVEMTGVEPVSEKRSALVSPGADTPTGFPRRQAGARAAASVASWGHDGPQSLRPFTFSA